MIVQFGFPFETLTTVLTMVFWSQFDTQLFGMLCPSVLVQGLLDVRLVVTQVAGVVVDCTVAFLVTEMSKSEIVVVCSCIF